MNHAALLDGSDAQDRNASSHSERCAALKRHLHHVVIILESFDQPSRDNLKQDEHYNDLLNRFISSFTTSPLPDLVSQVDQVIKNGLKDITANITKLAIRGPPSSDVISPPTKRAAATFEPNILPPFDISMNVAQLAGRKVNEPSKKTSGPKALARPGFSSSPSTSQILQVPKSVFPATSPREASGPQQSTSAASSMNMMVHFLKGSCKLRVGELRERVNPILATKGGRITLARYIYQDPDNRLCPIGMVWTCSNDSETFFRALENANFTFVWTKRAVVHIRRERTISYGLRILSSKHVYDPEVQKSMGYSAVAEINRAYLQETATSSTGQSPAVTKDLGRGVYLFSGPEAQDLEDVVAARRKTVTFYMSQFNPTRDLTLDVAIEPFRLCDLT